MIARRLALLLFLCFLSLSALADPPAAAEDVATEKVATDNVAIDDLLTKGKSL